MFTIKSLATGAATSLLLISSVFMSGCSDNKKDIPDAPVVESKDIDISASNIKSWTNYMVQVSYLLKTDADNLLSAWTTSYNGGRSFAESFKNFALNEYPSAVSCTEEIIDKMAEIANEVGQAKIGDPYALYIANRREEALYAVESWYSWHSRDDYTNNIYSIRNAYFGSLNGSVEKSSLSSLIKAIDPTLDKAIADAINMAATSIQAIQQPFRNNIPGAATLNAMEACAQLEDILNNQLKPLAVTLPESDLTEMVAIYVDKVVVPTYTALSQNNSLLNEAVKTLAANPNNTNFEKACRAWITAREPWETSEAFLFGPVDAMGLDPNMDSWPLDQDNIVQILNSGNFDNLNRIDGDDDDTIEAVQSVRGFHTLEFLLFKDGKPRTVNF